MMPTPNQGGCPTQQPFAGQPMGNATMISGVNMGGGMPQNFGEPAPKGQLFGFLFSVSKTLAGEYWPLYLGANTIGRGPQNSVVLNEGSVSENHASIHVISRSGNLVVYVTDTASKTGTLLNGNLLRGEADLKHGDIITVGEHYELLVLLVNPMELGLKPVEGFIASQATPAAPVGMPGFGGPVPGPMPRPNDVPRGGATVVEGQAGATPVGGHTVIMGGPVR